MAFLRPYHTLLLTLYCYNSIAQNNLVPNGSYEYYTPVCPFTVGMVTLAFPWYDVGTSDYFHMCSPPGSVSVPSNSFGYQVPKKDSAYVGFIVYYSTNSGYREYVAVRLRDSLRACEQYMFTMHISLSDKAGRAIDEIGAYFSRDSIQKIGGQDLLPYTPQVSSQDGVFLTDTMNWMEVRDTFTAEGGEQFLVIGNFKSDMQTDTLCIDCITPWKTSDYYFLDDVSLYHILDLHAAASSETICSNETVTLQACGDTVFAWKEQGKQDTLAATKTVTVSPEQTTTYIVSGSGGRKDSVTVVVQPSPCCVWQESITFPNIFTPNKDNLNETFSISAIGMLYDFSLKIFNRWGQLVYESDNIKSQWNGTINGFQAPEGIYYWIIAYKSECSDIPVINKGFLTLKR